MRTLCLTFVCILLSALPCRAAEPPLKIGAVFSLTGWAAMGGGPELNATRMAVDEINSAGGVLGRTIELVVEDTQSDLGKTVSAIHKLRSLDDISIIFGPNWAEFADVAAPKCDDEGIIMLTSSGYSATLTKDRTHVFSVIPPHAMITAPFSAYIARQEYTKIALVTSVSTYFESLTNAVTAQLADAGVRIADRSVWNPGTADFRSYISKLKAGKFDAVIAFLGESGDIGVFLKQARELKLGIPVYASNALLYDDTLTKGGDAAEGVILFEYRTLAPPAFLTRFAATYGGGVSHSVPRAYDTVYLLKTAIERCQTVAIPQLRECIRRIDYTGVSGRIRFNASGNLIPDGVPSELLQVRGGKAVLLVTP